mmetsp:Transcript_29677/g.50114  ORF Transcript_29677/g.50114 Transcript_29677/m.50114 type:complete len:85 (-) Transcript_29677:195-449(-)
MCCMCPTFICRCDDADGDDSDVSTNDKVEIKFSTPGTAFSICLGVGTLVTVVDEDESCLKIAMAESSQRINSRRTPIFLNFNHV